MRKEWLVVHASATEDGDTFSWSAIRRFHMQDRGWRDIGYHFGTERVQGHYENIMGRFWDDQGAHCPDGGMNAKGLGWCIVGNFDIVAPSPDLWMHCVKTAADLCRVLKLPYDHIIGHREAQKKWGQVTKTCPGKKFDMDRFRMAVEQYDKGLRTQ